MRHLLYSLLLLIGPLAGQADQPLTLRFEDDLATQEWSLVKSGDLPIWQPPGAVEALPVQLLLTDAISGVKTALVPSAYFVTEARQRWGGRTLGINWVLVLAGSTAQTLTVSAQLESDRHRLVVLDAGLTNRPPDAFIRAGNDAREARLHQILDQPEEGRLGLRYHLALDPRSGVRPGHTTFQFTIEQGAREGNGPHQKTDTSELQVALEAYVKAQARGELAIPFLPAAPEENRACPVLATLVEPEIATLDEEARIEVALFNGSSAEQLITLTTGGEREAVPGPEILLQPGESRVATMTIPSNQHGSGEIPLVVTASGVRALEAKARITFLDETASLARDSRVRIEVDSTLSGYNRRGLTDGQIGGDGGPDDAWASDETTAAHWVRVTFPQPTAVSELRLFWGSENGRTFTSRRGQLIGWTAAGEQVMLASVEPQPGEVYTLVPFDTLQLSAMEWRQAAGAGSEDRPNLLWLNELEVR